MNWGLFIEPTSQNAFLSFKDEDNMSDVYECIPVCYYGKSGILAKEFRRMLGTVDPLGLLKVEFEREKFYPGPGLEPGPLSFRASALPTEPFRTSTSPR